MKKSILTIYTFTTLFFSSAALNSAIAAPQVDELYANQTAIKLLLRTQNLSERQAELAFNAIAAIRTFAEKIKQDKTKFTSYLTELTEQEEINVTQTMSLYKKWQSDLDQELQRTLIAVANLHGQLTKQQRREIFHKLQSLSQ